MRYLALLLFVLQSDVAMFVGTTHTLVFLPCSVQDIAQFLIDNYGNTSTAVVIYEADEPYYLIGTSTGSDSVTKVLTADMSKPCPVQSGNNAPCTPIRIPIQNLTGHPMDAILVRAYYRQSQAGYPEGLLSVKASDSLASAIYVSQTVLYEQQAGSNLKWRVLIVSPGEKSTTDSITRGSNVTLFSAVCVIAAIGLLVCFGFFLYFYGKRTEAAVIHADWRFTCAFILGCSVLNGSSFALLGPNTDVTCLLRMWAFHTLFVVALSPLFVKVWRMHQLVGGKTIRRKAISNTQAALYTLPLILVQVTILIIITFLDPPKQKEIIEDNDGVIIQRVVCAADSNAMLIVEVVFEAGVVLVGCILAYMTRNLDSKFGEAKQLIFAMYNIALVGVIILLVINLTQMSSDGSSVLQAVGVFWGTVISSAAFVLPRMIQIREQVQTGRRGQVRLSGIEPPSKPFNLPKSTLLSIEEESTSMDVSMKFGESPVIFNSENKHFANTLVQDGDVSSSPNIAEMDDREQANYEGESVSHSDDGVRGTAIGQNAAEGFEGDNHGFVESSARQKKRMIESNFRGEAKTD